MDRWTKLYRKLQIVETEREARQRDAVEKKAAFERWCRVATGEALGAIVEGLQHRGDEFTRYTGVQVVVEAPKRGPVEMGEGGPRMSFVRVLLGFARVDLYSHREPDGFPVLYVAQGQVDPDQAPVSRRADVILSTPIATLNRCGDDGWELHRLGTGEGQIEMDELVYGLFERLVSLHTRTARGSKSST